MSISESEELHESTEMPTSEEKPKSKLSPERLEKLKLAREKALEKKRLLKELTDKEKQIRHNKLQERINTVNDELTRSTEVIDNHKPKPKKPKPKVLESSSEEESEEEQEMRAPTRKAKSKLPTSQLTAMIARDELQRRIMQDNFKQAYNSIFPMSTFNMNMM
jgi:hypothetical protein